MEKGKNLFQEQEPAQRLESLINVSTKQETQKVRRHYDEDERAMKKDFIANESISIMERKEDFAEIRKEFNTAVTVLTKAVTGELKDLKRGFSENEETVYMIAEYDEDLMYIYDGKGTFLQSRKLYPEERQKTIVIPMERTGTNN